MNENELKKRISEARNVIYGLLNYMNPSDEPTIVNAVYYSTSARLRMQAEEMDRRDKAIHAARDFLSTPDDFPQ